MRPPYRILVLTDHSGHTSENSLYGLVGALNSSGFCRYIDIGSRGCDVNRPFFQGIKTEVYVKRVRGDIFYSEDGSILTNALIKSEVTDYDVILLRMPPPPDQVFFHHLSKWVSQRIILNRPSGIIETSSKEFLLQFRRLCAPVCLCRTAEEVDAFSALFPIVLKPLTGYGGRGIIKIENDEVWIDGRKLGKNTFLSEFRRDGKVYLGMKYLRNVLLGDKRNIVVNGKLIGSSLRVPQEGGWMCNVALGGRSTAAQPDEREMYISGELWKVLKELGIIIFGFDTLVDDNGDRVLSEINTMSVGGLVQTADHSGKPIVSEAVNLLWAYINDVVYGDIPVNFR